MRNLVWISEFKQVVLEIMFSEKAREECGELSALFPYGRFRKPQEPSDAMLSRGTLTRYSGMEILSCGCW